MTTLTQNLKLNVPEFDQTPWDTEVNSNWAILDATVGLFTAIPNMAGVWVNNKSYTVGQSVIDGTDSSIWYCLQTHTTPAPPTTFSGDRILNPARWTQTSGSAQFYAQQAANAAAQAITAANDAQEAVDSLPEMLPLIGGTMTGPLILSSDPVDVLGAATRQYVDARVGGTGYLPITGGIMTGALYAGGNGIGYMNIVPTDRVLIAFGWSGAYVYATQAGAYAGALATREFVAANYLSLSGGSVGGTITTTGELRAQNTIRLTAPGASLIADASYIQLTFDTNNWRLRYNRANAALEYVRGTDNTSMFQLDSLGNGFISRNFTAYGALEIDGSIFARGGTLFLGPTDRTKIITDASNYTIFNMVDEYQWYMNWANGELKWKSFGSDNFTIRAGDGVIGNDRSHMYGHGAYVDVSDERMKEEITPLQHGLDRIMLIQPIKFKRVGFTREEEGFSAQQLQTVLPLAVSNVYADTLGVSVTPIVAALVNGMQELTARLVHLEKKDEATRH